MSTFKGSIVLSINTAVLPLEVAVYEEGVAAARRGGEEAATDGFASHTVLSVVDEVCRAAQIDLRDINLFAVACGPGSFTGLRSGIAVVKGLAQTLRRPCVGVSTLHATAWNEFTSGASQRRRRRAAEHIIAVLPAGRSEVYAQVVCCTERNTMSEVTRPLHLTPHALLARVQGIADLHWCGAGAHAMSKQIAEAAAQRCGRSFESLETASTATAAIELGARHDESDKVENDGVWTLGVAARHRSIAESVAQLARQALKENRAISAAQLQACYVRLSDAELNEICHKQNSTAT